MTDVTNGASLEDCHTNLFSLADLSEFKWRRLCADSVVCVNPLDDPILLAYSKCLLAGNLCVWRRAAAQRTPFSQGFGGDGVQFSHSKELWVFWYGEEPDLTDLVGPNLREVEKGSWETGLSYECRTLLFKALHNLIEKCLLSRGFTRLGRFFVEPQSLPHENASRSQIAFAFNFFIHGESTVCASVDMRVAPSVYPLQKCHLAASQCGETSVKVILGPYGMAGTLTGQAYKYGDPVAAKLLKEWQSFYPFPKLSEAVDDSAIPDVVEVLVGSVHLKYPTSYVFVVEDDHVSVCGAGDESGGQNPSGALLVSSGANIKPNMSLNLLTPPTSPERSADHGDVHTKPGAYGQRNASKKHNSLCTAADSDNSQGLSLQAVIKYAANEEASLILPSEGNEENRPMWEFQDPSTISKCCCFRKSTSSLSETKGHHWRENGAGSARSSRNERTHTSSRFLPFHKRNASEEADLQEPGPLFARNHVVTGGSATATVNATQSKTYSLSSSLDSGGLVTIPQLHTTPVTQPSSVDSHSNVPSVETSCSVVCSSDPLMPTLSPHPPATKEATSNSAANCDVVFAHSPSADIGHTINIKEKAMPDEMLSPFHASLLTYFENAKESDSAGAAAGTSGAAANAEEAQQQSAVADGEDGNEGLPQALKRPVIPCVSQDDYEEDMVMRGALYTYTKPSFPFSDPHPSKRRRIRSVGSEVEAICIDGEADKSCALYPAGQTYATKDPYEFTEFDETTVQENTAPFRVHTELRPKEEEKLPVAEDFPSPAGDLSPGALSATNHNPHSDEPANTAADVEHIPYTMILSPATRALEKGQPKFIRAEDLAFTPHDLDNIFDTSSSDSDDMCLDPDTPTNGTADDVGMKSKNGNMTTGLLDLSRMFPTPPSFEQNAIPSPLNGPSGSDNAMSDNDSKKDCNTSEILALFLESEAKDPAVVWALEEQQSFLESASYSPLTDLPLTSNPVILPSECMYKPSWEQQRLQQQAKDPVKKDAARPPSDSYIEKHIPLNQTNRYLPLEDERMYGSAFPVDPMLDQRFMLQVTDTQSPASSSSSYINKHVNSVEILSVTPPAPEAHSLYVNLLLSDSMLNIFKDHNFDSCSLCVCNMNIKGSDVGVNLPSSLMPAGNDTPQYKCTCGFSAVVYRHQSYCAGMFFEDEIDIAGFTMDDEILSRYQGADAKHVKEETKQENLIPADQIQYPLIDLIRTHCKSLCSSFCLLHKPNTFMQCSVPPQSNALMIRDASEVCVLALEAAIENVISSRSDDSLKSSCLHKWPYSTNPLPSPSQELMLHLETLKPLLQEAVHKKKTLHMWDYTPTHVVSGPLTWREFHILLSERGDEDQVKKSSGEDQCEPQPIPSVSVGYDKDCLSLSPFALKYWDKLMLEPYSLPRDVAYIVVTPESDYIISRVKSFFQELSSIYELYRLGKHKPITKVLRDGFMRVGKNAALKLADEPVDDWFNQIGDSAISSRLKLYARVCRHRLAPHLSTLPLDKSLLEVPSSKAADRSNVALTSGGSPAPSSQDSSQDQGLSVKHQDLDADGIAGSSAVGVGNLTPGADMSGGDDDNHEPPAIVIYIVEPFTFSSVSPSLYRMVTLSLMNCYLQMLNYLPDAIRNAISVQFLSLDSILSMGKNDNGCKRNEELKTLAFSVFSQCHRLLPRQTPAKSLTGFGPAAAQDMFLGSKDPKMLEPVKIYNQPLILASMKDKQRELGEMFGDTQEKSGVLYCSYCLTGDKKWLLASCADDKGELMETTVINIAVPNRSGRRKGVGVRRFGLQKLLDFILEVLTGTVYPWRIIIGRVGKLGHGELRDWASLLSRKSLLSYSRKLQEMCKQCSGLSPGDTPSLLSACLVSVEPDPAHCIMPDQFTPSDRFSTSSSNSCRLSTPEDATCTHILVFPTSAMQSSHESQEHFEDFLQGLADDDVEMNVDPEMSDILAWPVSPTQPLNNSPCQDSLSQPSSPTAVPHNLPFHLGEPNRGMSMVSDNQDEPLQLLQQPLALAYYVSTAKTGPMPTWFWSTCPHLVDRLPVFLKFALLIHLPSVQQSSDDILHANSHNRNCHPLDSNLTTDVLRYVLEGYNKLSWLSLDPASHDRRSCLPIHIQILMHLYQIVETILS